MGRFLIRISNEKRFHPKDIPRVKGLATQTVSARGARAENFRVSTQAIEFDLFLPEGQAPEHTTNAISRTLGSLLTIRQLDGASKRGKEEIIREARSFWEEERYWEVHETLEEIWRREGGAEKELLQGIILVAAALVHYQRHELDVCLRMLQKALPKLKWNNEAYHGIGIRELREKVARMVREESPEPFRNI